MTEGAIVALDAGSSGPRCLVYDGEGRVVGESSGGWIYDDNYHPLATHIKFDAPAVWGELCATVRAALADAGGPPVAAVAVTGQRQAVVFLDDAGRELYVGPNRDLGALFPGAQLDSESADAIYAATGRLPSMLFTHAKLRYFRHFHPRAYAGIARVLTLPSWIAWKMTGELAEEPSLAIEAGLLDFRSGDWYAPPFEEAGIDPTAVRLVPPGEFAGAVREEAARETGLPRGVPVCVAGPDTQCGLLGMGVAEQGQVGIVAGWSAPVQMVTDSPTLARDKSAWTGRHIVPGKWIVESNAGDLGNANRWLAEVMFGDAEEGYAAMNDLAASVDIRSDGAAVLLNSPRMNVTALGMTTGGLLFPAPVTFSGIGRGHLARAHLEAAAYTLRANLEQVEDAAGSRASAVRLGGGMARMSTFREIAAAVLGWQIGVSTESNVSAFGAYLCAAAALGRYDGLADAAASAETRLEPHTPEPLARGDYDEGYENWLELAKYMEGWTLE